MGGKIESAISFENAPGGQLGKEIIKETLKNFIDQVAEEDRKVTLEYIKGADGKEILILQVQDQIHSAGVIKASESGCPELIEDNAEEIVDYILKKIEEIIKKD